MRLQLQGHRRPLNAGVTRRGIWLFVLKALLKAYFGEWEWGADSIIPTPPGSISVSVIGLPNPCFSPEYKDCAGEIVTMGYCRDSVTGVGLDAL